jgi:hypothetical protein
MAVYLRRGGDQFEDHDWEGHLEVNWYESAVVWWYTFNGGQEPRSFYIITSPSR